MKILALDIASATGFACGLPGERPVYGTYRVPKSLIADELGKRYSAFQDWLADLLAVHQPNLVTFEAPVPPRGNNIATTFQTVRLLLGLAAIAEMLAYRYEADCVECHIATVRKFFAGHGRADKNDVMKACFNRGWPVATDHEADALAVLSYTQHVSRANRRVAEPLAMGRA